jgi:hypothetical protein
MSVGHAFISQKGGDLKWSTPRRKYLWGAVVAPHTVVIAALPAVTRWFTPAFAWILGRLSKHRIAADIGCDSTLEAAPSPNMPLL